MVENNELRCDWEVGAAGVSVAAIRWRRAKTWGGAAISYRRDAAWALWVGETAHGKLSEMLRTVVSVDSVVQDACADLLAGATAWDGAVAAPIMKQVRDGVSGAGVPEGSPLWIAADRAAARALQKRRDRWKAYGWLKPVGAGEIVHTLRLPFGTHYGAPLTGDVEGLLHDDLLLGGFSIRPLGTGDQAQRFRPQDCSYAEAALLAKGWRIRFVQATDVGE